MSLAPASIRSRIAAAIAAEQPSWRESHLPLPMMLSTLTRGDNAVHGDYAVWVDSSRADRGRQRAATGAYTTTEVQVGLSWTIRPDVAISDMDAALTAELALVAAVLTASGDPDLSIRWGSCSRGLSTAGRYIALRASFEVTHFYPLS